MPYAIKTINDYKIVLVTNMYPTINIEISINILKFNYPRETRVNN